MTDVIQHELIHYKHCLCSTTSNTHKPTATIPNTQPNAFKIHLPPFPLYTQYHCLWSSMRKYQYLQRITKQLSSMGVLTERQCRTAKGSYASMSQLQGKDIINSSLSIKSVQSGSTTTTTYLHMVSPIFVAWLCSPFVTVKTGFLVKVVLEAFACIQQVEAVGDELLEGLELENLLKKWLHAGWTRDDKGVRVKCNRLPRPKSQSISVAT